MLITKNELDEFGTLADQFIINSDHESLAALVERFTKHDFEFPHPLYEAHYLYCLGNCYSELYRYRSIEWYSDDLMNAIIFYRKALHTIPKTDWKDHEVNRQAYNDLRSLV